MKRSNSDEIGRSQRAEHMGFQDGVTEIFCPIMNTLGLHLVSATPFAAIFESDRMYLYIEHGVHDYVIDFTIGQLSFGRREHEYTSYELMKVKGFSGQTSAVARNSSEVLRRLRELADFTMEYCIDALKGDVNALDQLDKAVTQLRLEFARHSEVRSIRAQADRAWQNRDYDEVYQLYNRIGSELTADEAERLEYAYKVILGIAT